MTKILISEVIIKNSFMVYGKFSCNNIAQNLCKCRVKIFQFMIFYEPSDS